MENSKNNSVPTEKTLGRRELLKALAATGSAVVASSMLPNQWTKPVIEAGVLPAHAQGSKPTATPTPKLIVSPGDADPPSSLYEYRLIEPNKNTIQLSYSNNNRIEIPFSNASGEYTLKAKYIGPKPEPEPVPRPFIVIELPGGRRIQAGQPGFLNDGNFNEIGRFTI